MKWLSLFKQSVMAKTRDYTSRKFTITAGSLLAVFALVYLGKDVRSLEIIVPAILAFYHGGNVMQRWVESKQGETK